MVNWNEPQTTIEVITEVIAAVQLLQKSETERTRIILELKQEISDL